MNIGCVIGAEIVITARLELAHVELNVSHTSFLTHNAHVVEIQLLFIN